jgi:hypothetical protein
MKEIDMENTSLPDNRKTAIDAGQVFYFTGYPCKRGHVAKRYTTSGQCIECVREIFRAKANKIKEMRSLSQPVEEQQREEQKVETQAA